MLKIIAKQTNNFQDYFKEADHHSELKKQGMKSLHELCTHITNYKKYGQKIIGCPRKLGSFQRRLNDEQLQLFQIQKCDWDTLATTPSCIFG